MVQAQLPTLRDSGRDPGVPRLYADLKAELQGLLLPTERQWCEVSEGLLESQEKNRLTIDVRE